MSTHPVQMLDPVFRFLDGLIRDYGDYLYLALVYASIPLIAWILRGGLRRRDPGRAAHASIIIIHTHVGPPQPPPLPCRRKCDLTSDAGEDSFAA